MQNLLLTYAYNGARFCGSQSQPHGRSVEDTLKIALGRVGIFGALTTSSRTDKGVHALRQTSTIKCELYQSLPRLKELINRHCAPYIFVRDLRVVSDEFHPRYSAKARAYRYIINHGEFNPFLSDFQIFMPKFEIEKLNLILAKFIGEHDFSEFMKVGSEIKSPVREIFVARAYSHGNLSVVNFVANGFLRAQVRLMLANALASLKSNRPLDLSHALTRIPAPPNGLYLANVIY
ncbi:MAG: tRNA pseudouridine(38-40) synthase TruA [Campylobacter sp.]|nr:tRNA pseudouridine(38-40) synthase TruA [Campylobacter sp.]